MFTMIQFASPLGCLRECVPMELTTRPSILGKELEPTHRKPGGALRAWMDREGMAGDLMDGKYNNRFILLGENFLA